MNVTNPAKADGMDEDELGRMGSIIIMKLLNGKGLFPKYMLHIQILLLHFVCG